MIDQDQEQDSQVRVLLIESEKDTISLLTLCLSEIKECEAHFSENIAHALLYLQKHEPDLILYSHNHEDKDSLRILSAIHQKHPSLYLIVSLPESDAELMDEYMRSGARDCVVKDKKYVANLMVSVKSALIRIAERESIVLPTLSHVDRFAMDENLPDLVFLIDREGRILHVNRAIKDSLGMEQNEAIHMPFIDLLGPESQKLFREFLQRLDLSRNFRGPVTVKNFAGEELQFEINCTFVEDMIYGVLRRAASWEAVAQMIDVLNQDEIPEETLQPGESEDQLPAKLGPYKVVTLLGAGAMGRVYKGYDEDLDRYVAIKVIGKSLSADPDDLTRFHREAKILASITHPNIALIFYYGDREGPPFFCMEFMAGGSVEEVLQKKGHLDPETAISYAMQVAMGLSEAAKKGVVHLDIKPSNLMLAENDRVKIVDFGLAKTGRDLESGTVGLVGTPHYIAPEQVQGNPVDYRADIYSLGVTFYRMLYGSLPFGGNTIVEILHNQLHGELPPREKLNPDVPPVVYDIIRKMVARDPVRRYATYSEVIQDLENARRSLHEQVPSLEMPSIPETTIAMRGLLYDHPFAEILGEIVHRNLTGRLTLSWVDLRKNIHFKNGKIVAVLSNQEGESFIELLMRGHHLSTKKARQIQSNSIDLFRHYSTAMNELDPDLRQSVVADIHALAWKILQGLFSWMVGEFIFEKDDFQGQIAMQIPCGDVMLRGVKEWVDISLIHRRLMKGQCLIVRSSNYQKLLPAIKMKPADTFLLFRFEGDIHFKDLFNLSGISEEEFYRLIYLFKCAGIVDLKEETHPEPVAAKAHRKPAAPPPAPPVVAPPPAQIRKERIVPASHPEAAPVRPQPTPPPAAESAPPAAAKEAAPSAEAKPQHAHKPAEAAQDYYKLAQQSFKNKNYWAAVEYCKKSLELRKDVQTYLLMGNAFATHPNFRFEGMNAYKEALALDPENSLVHRGMADLYYKTGNLALAKAKYAEVLNLNPIDEVAEKCLAMVISKMKK